MELPGWASGAWGFVGPIIAGAVVALLGTYFALRRFRQERWWEKKSEAYTKLVEHLTSLHIGFEQIDELSLRSSDPEEFTPEDEKALDDTYRRIRAPYEAVRRSTIEAAAVLSPAAIEILKAFLNECVKRSFGDRFREPDELSEAAAKAAKALQEEMKGDLGA